MLFDRKQTCSKCGTINPPNANYCIKCNTPLSAGSKKCGFCGQINAADAIYCQECGQRLEEGEAPLIINNRWRTLEKEFA